MKTRSIFGTLIVGVALAFSAAHAEIQVDRSGGTDATGSNTQGVETGYQSLDFQSIGIDVPDLEELKTKISELQDKTDVHETTLDTHSSNLQSLESRVTTNRNKADTAQSSADSAMSRANSAYSRADSAYTRANSAYSRADSAMNRATSARNRADDAYSRAGSARNRADDAYALADGAKSRADSAYSRAGSARNRANSAYDLASGAAQTTTRTRTVSIPYNDFVCGTSGRFGCTGTYYYPVEYVMATSCSPTNTAGSSVGLSRQYVGNGVYEYKLGNGSYYDGYKGGPYEHNPAEYSCSTVAAY